VCGGGPSNDDIAAACCITITVRGQKNTWAPHAPLRAWEIVTPDAWSRGHASQQSCFWSCKAAPATECTVTPQSADLTPFAMTSPSQFRAKPPDLNRSGSSLLSLAPRATTVRVPLGPRSGGRLGHSAMVGSMSGLRESGRDWAIYEFGRRGLRAEAAAPAPGGDREIHCGDFAS
jgi:hypothetical protein